MSRPQYHLPRGLYDSIEATAPELKAVRKFDFDAAAEFVMPDISCFLNARNDPYYATHVFPDEQYLFDWTSAYYTVGYEEVYIKDNKVVDLRFGDHQQ